MLEIPVIAQGFMTNDSPYQADPEDAAHMKVVVDNSKWMDEIDELIKNKELRLEMGKKAREYVLSKYQIKDNIYKWQAVYDSLYAEKG